MPPSQQQGPKIRNGQYVRPEVNPQVGVCSSARLFVVRQKCTLVRSGLWVMRAGGRGAPCWGGPWRHVRQVGRRAPAWGRRGQSISLGISGISHLPAAAPCADAARPEAGWEEEGGRWDLRIVLFKLCCSLYSALYGSLDAALDPLFQGRFACLAHSACCWQHHAKVYLFGSNAWAEPLPANLLRHPHAALSAHPQAWGASRQFSSGPHPPPPPPTPPTHPLSTPLARPGTTQSAMWTSGSG